MGLCDVASILFDTVRSLRTSPDKCAFPRNGPIKLYSYFSPQ